MKLSWKAGLLGNVKILLLVMKQWLNLFES